MGDCQVEPETPTNETLCLYPDLINNGECNIEIEYSELCNFDGNDCLEPVPACATPELIGDGTCHANLMNESCSFDGWDCCQTAYPDWIGDGICDEIHNNMNCNYDGTDCATDALNEETELAETCNPEEAYMLNWIGDNICDTALNIEECDFDGGDCDADENSTPPMMILG